MRPSQKRRLETRYPLPEPIPVRVLLRSLSRTGNGVAGELVDVSKNGMGVVVQERVALASQCSIEVLWQSESQLFDGEVCYARRTEEGIRLGILLAGTNDPPILDYLASRGLRF